MTILGIDASVAGISGDMCIAALSQLVTDFDLIQKNFLEALAGLGYSLDFELISTEYYGIKGMRIDFKGNNQKLTVEKIYDLFTNLSNELNLIGTYRQFGNDILDTIVEAEKEIHGTQNIELHELGTLDTVIDIFLTSYLLQELKISGIVLSAVATGKGSVKTAHGVLPIPAPVTEHILEKSKLATTSGPEIEATTPTGAGIVYALKKNFPFSENIIWNSNALGFGNKKLKDRGNFLRFRLGEVSQNITSIYKLETNIDDVTGEILGDALSRLDAGALDVLYFPIITKKNRPGYSLNVLAETSKLDHLVNLIMELTGTLGVRILKIDRHVGARAIKKVEVFVEEFNQKVSFHIKEGTRKKIEFDDLVKLSNQFNLSPLRLEEILGRYY